MAGDLEQDMLSSFLGFFTAVGSDGDSAAPQLRIETKAPPALSASAQRLTEPPVVELEPPHKTPITRAEVTWDGNRLAYSDRFQTSVMSEAQSKCHT